MKTGMKSGTSLHYETAITKLTIFPHFKNNVFVDVKYTWRTSIASLNEAIQIIIVVVYDVPIDFALRQQAGRGQSNFGEHVGRIPHLY